MKPQNPFTIDTSRLQTDQILDRATELQKLNTVVLSRQENMLLTGQHGIGKTCLLKKFRAAIAADRKVRFLLVELEMLGMTATPGKFLSDLLLKLFAVAYNCITGKSFSTLLRSNSIHRDISSTLTPVIGQLIELYRAFKTRESSSNVQDTHTIGATAGLIAKREEKIGASWAAGELSTGEQLLIAYELLEILADKGGFSRVIVFGDEANHVSPDIEIDLYRSNFEAFSARNLQFVFTGNPALFDKIPQFHELFPNVMELTGFAEHRIIDELLDSYCSILKRNGASICFPPETRDLLWEISNGVPRELQRVCQAAVDSALETSVYEISPKVVLRSCIDVYSFVPRKPV